MLEHPDRWALLTTDGAVSYGQLYAAARQLAARLGPGGAEPGRVGLLASDPVDLLAGFYAGVLHGTSVVILDPAWPEQRLRSVLDTLNLTQIIHCARMEQRVGQLAPQVRGLRVARNQTCARHPAPEPLDAHRELMVVFTSGTTARPKAICRSRASWRASLRLGSRILRAYAGEATLIPGPLAHGLSLYAAIEVIATGGTALLTGRWDPSRVGELLERHRCTRVVAVPSILTRLLAQDRCRLVSLRYVVCGGEAMPASLRREYEALPMVRDVVEYYGTSEHSLVAYRNSAHDLPQDTVGFIGHPFPEVDIRIRRAHEQSGLGEIFVRSPMVATDYLDRSRHRFRRHADRISVRDHGRLTQGWLQVAGRADGMLNLGGNNVYPAEISEVLTRTLGIGQSRILPVTDAAGRPRLVAFLLVRELGANYTGQHLRDLLSQQLPGYKIPHELVLLERWPMTDSGKVASSRLQQAWSDPASTRVVLR